MTEPSGQVRPTKLLRRHKSLLVSALLGVVALAQLYLVLSDYGIRWAKAAWRTRSLPAEARSVRFLLGQRSADYVEFVKDIVPGDMSIVLPYGVGEFSQQSLLQFFFMPRAVLGCGCESTVFAELSQTCIDCLSGGSNAVLAIGDFPPSQAVNEDMVFVPHEYDTGWFHGVYLPESGGSSPREGDQDQSLPVLGLAGIAVVVASGLFLLGALLVGAVEPNPSWGMLMMLGWPLGIGVFTFVVFLLGWAGISIVATTFGASFVFLAGIFVLIRKTLWNPVNLLPSLADAIAKARKGLSSRRAGTIVIVVVGLLALLASVISVGRSYSTVDGMANWAIKGYAIAQNASILAGREWGKHGLAYPQNVPLLTALFRVIDGDALPGSKLIPPLLTTSMLAGCFIAWRRSHVPFTSAAWASLALITVPLLFLHATLGYVNLPFTSYLVLGTLLLTRGLVEQENASNALGSLLLGFAAWTRPEGVAMGLLLVITLLVANSIIHKRRRLNAYAVLPFLIVAGTWVAFGSGHIANDEIGKILSQFAPAVFGGDIRSEPLALVLSHAGKEFQDFSVWGLMILAILALIGVGYRNLAPQKNLSAFLPAVAGLAMLTFPLGMFYVAGYTPGYDEFFLEVSFARALLPAMVLLFWAAVAAASSPVSKNQGKTR